MHQLIHVTQHGFQAVGAILKVRVREIRFVPLKNLVDFLKSGSVRRGQAYLPPAVVQKVEKETVLKRIIILRKMGLSLRKKGFQFAYPLLTLIGRLSHQVNEVREAQTLIVRNRCPQKDVPLAQYRDSQFRISVIQVREKVLQLRGFVFHGLN